MPWCHRTGLWLHKRIFYQMLTIYLVPRKKMLSCSCFTRNVRDWYTKIKQALILEPHTADSEKKKPKQLGEFNPCFSWVIDYFLEKRYTWQNHLNCLKLYKFFSFNYRQVSSRPYSKKHLTRLKIFKLPWKNFKCIIIILDRDFLRTFVYITRIK